VKHARLDYQDRIIDTHDLIPSEEPVFLLRGQDKLAPLLVEQWALEAQKQGASQNIVNAAMEQAQKMVLWQKEHGSKIPDMPPVKG
jgi:hypothetical protein